MNNKKFITRFAPSPTGHLHIGGARTALLSYLFAKSQNGTFIVRTEDTDLKRHREEMVEQHINDLIWLGIKPDFSSINNKAFRQSQRLNIYKKYIEKMLSLKLAYKCYCTLEEINKEKEFFIKKHNNLNFIYSGKCKNINEKNKPFSIRINVDKSKIFIFYDLIRGKIEFKGSDFGDFVIQKADGFPTYNFAAVVDDIDMKITHVLRGEEHISNTGKQLSIYNALKTEPPKYGHLNLILNKDRKKLSKRDVTIIQFIDKYKTMGFLPEAITNFLGILGFKPDKEKEFFSINDLISTFSINKLSKSPSVFDYKKLIWFNKNYINRLSTKQYLSLTNNFCKNLYTLSSSDYIMLLEEYKSKIEYLSQLPNELDMFFNSKISQNIWDKLVQYDYLSIYKYLSTNKITKNMSYEKVCNYIDDLKNYFVKNKNYKIKDIFIPFRIIISGKDNGIDLKKTFYILNKTILHNTLSNRKVIFKNLNEE